MKCIWKSLSLLLNQDDWRVSLVAIISKEAREEMQTFNPETTVEKRSKKKAGLAREREKDTFSMSESKVTNFYLRLEKKYVFYYLVYLRLYSFCNWDFGTIAWIAVSSETECHPFVMSKTSCRNFMINFLDMARLLLPRYI